MHIEKLAWAVSLMNGAKRIVDGDPNATIKEIASPLYLLLGFSVENALKAYLSMRGCIDRKTNHSHDLIVLRDECRIRGLKLRDESSEFVEVIAPHHSDYTFRYPEKAGHVNLFKPAYAVMQTEILIATITITFNPLEIQGWASNPIEP